ncbi:MAG: T9SS type A sorting domain-containing protein [Candidatus Latescibacteria bacterium]|nr:T9SS type A sorting domain-containing protein [Candidatus Latescibacterota bacterium]
MALRILSLLVLALVLVAPIWAQAQGPGEIHVTPKVDLGLVPVEVEGMEGRTLNVPPGFRVALFAEGVEKARLMAWSPDSVLHVVSMKTRGNNEWSADPDHQSTILALPDRDRDGRADEVRVVADGFLWPNSVAFYEGAMYVGDTDELVRLYDRDGNGFYEEREVLAELAGSQPGGGAQHITHTVVFDEVNDKMYVHQGSSCDLCREEDPERATILEFNPDGSGRRIFASGLRNAIGMDIHPVTNQLWANNNGHDRDNFPNRDGIVGEDMPPEWVGIVREGAFYGWPLAHGYQVWVDFGVNTYFENIAPFSAQDTLNVLSMERPVATIAAHTAPMALHFYPHDQLDVQYKNAAFVALRAGSRGNDPGYKVMVVFSDPDGSNARTADFLTGFRPDPSRNTVWGKPVGLESDTRGNLYLSSDHTNQVVLRIYQASLVGRWEGALPDTVLSGSNINLDVDVVLSRFVEGGSTPVLTADLSALGGAAAVPLTPVGDGQYRLDTDLVVQDGRGPTPVVVLARQDTDEGPVELVLNQRIFVVPDQDLVIWGEQQDAAWTLDGVRNVEVAPSGVEVFAGDTALGLESSGSWSMSWIPASPVALLGGEVLRLAVHPGSSSGGFLNLTVNSTRVRVWTGNSETSLVNWENAAWQVVELNLEELEIGPELTGVRINGDPEGAFFFDEFRLGPPNYTPPPTAVLETFQQGTPEQSSLGQNYPNPFNSGTAIGFTLAETAPIELAVYNLAGQKVATLAAGLRMAGNYLLQWDGRADSGAELASGAYFYRLRMGDRVQTRKLLLLR